MNPLLLPRQSSVDRQHRQAWLRDIGRDLSRNFAAGFSVGLLVASVCWFVLFCTFTG